MLHSACSSDSLEIKGKNSQRSTGGRSSFVVISEWNRGESLWSFQTKILNCQLTNIGLSFGCNREKKKAIPDDYFDGRRCLKEMEPSRTFLFLFWSDADRYVLEWERKKDHTEKRTFTCAILFCYCCCVVCWWYKRRKPYFFLLTQTNCSRNVFNAGTLLSCDVAIWRKVPRSNKFAIPDFLP